METTKSADGTVIAYDHAGDGPPLVIAVGAFCDRRTFDPPAELTARFAVYTFDRRGRADSGDTPPYAPAREIEDFAAVVEAAGGGAAVLAYGHSSGASLVLRAAAQGVPLARVVAYEAPFIAAGTRELAGDPVGHITGLVAAGRRDEAVRYWMTDVTQAPPEVLPMLENSPAWPRSPRPCSSSAGPAARTGSTAPWRPRRPPSRVPGCACSRATTITCRPRPSRP